MTRYGGDDPTSTHDVLDERWVCLKCNATFRLGKVKVHSYSERYPHGISCPNCGSGHGLHPASGETVTLNEYHGEKGTVQ